MARGNLEAAEALRRYFEDGVEAPGLFTDPYIAWHCYDKADKIARPGVRDGVVAKDQPDRRAKRVRVIPGENAVTCLLTNEVPGVEGPFEVHVCLVHFLDAQGRVHRVEAYYDPAPLQQDRWMRHHLSHFEGVAHG